MSSGLLIGGDVVELMEALGIPTGTRFDFVFTGCAPGYLELTPAGVYCTGDPEIEKRDFHMIVLVWMLSHFGASSGLGVFSSPQSAFELKRVGDFARVVAAPDFEAMPIPELARRLQNEMDIFWINLNRERGTEPALQ